MSDPGFLKSRDSDLFFPIYSRLDLIIDHGEGAVLYASDGRTYLDFIGGLAVNALGYAHPSVVDAVTRQVARYSHLSNYFVQQPQIELAARLTSLVGLPRLFFCNSGTEAVEAAVKLARKWGNAQGRSRIVGFSGGFHGRTMSALSIMGQETYRSGYGPFLNDCLLLPFNDIEALHAGIDEHTAAVFIEFVQGEAGVIPADRAFIAALERMRAEHGFLLVADEVQCGVGRTGRFNAFEHWDVQPDIVLLAKAIGGGLPLGAVLTTDELSRVYGPAGHGTTFGGNPVACAAGAALIDVMLREHLISNAAWIGATMLDGLEKLSTKFPGMVRDVRGAGCMFAIELAFPATDFVRICRELGLLVNMAQPNVVRMLPSYILDAGQVRQALDIIGQALAQVLDTARRIRETPPPDLAEDAATTHVSES